MAIRTELAVRLQNSPGALTGVCQALAADHINILALSLEPGGTLRLVVDNPVHAGGVLRDRHYRVDERDVVYTLVPNEPGSMSRVMGMLSAAGVNVEYAYAAALESDRAVGVVIGVAEAQRAAALTGM